MSAPPDDLTGDPWIDAWLKFRHAVLDNATSAELVTFAQELKRGLPHPTPSIPAALFIHQDIIITCGSRSLTPEFVTALWTPSEALIPDGNGNGH